MKTLQIDEKKAKSLYEKASPEFQYVPEDMSEDDFEKIIQGRIKSYEDACRELGLDPERLPKVDDCDPENRASIIAFYKLTIIARALNEGWRPNWQDSHEYKYYPWFNMTNPAGANYSFVLNTASHAYTNICSRLCCKSDKLATYFGTQFEKLWAEYLLL